MALWKLFRCPAEPAKSWARHFARAARQLHMYISKILRTYTEHHWGSEQGTWQRSAGDCRPYANKDAMLECAMLAVLVSSSYRLQRKIACLQIQEVFLLRRLAAAGDAACKGSGAVSSADSLWISKTSPFRKAARMGGHLHRPLAPFEKKTSMFAASSSAVVWTAKYGQMKPLTSSSAVSRGIWSFEAMQMTRTPLKVVSKIVTCAGRSAAVVLVKILAVNGTKISFFPRSASSWESCP